MTTPDRLRRRQRRNDIITAAVALLCVSSTVYFIQTGKADDRCFRSYVQQTQATGKVRSGLVEWESWTTRQAIRAAGTATTREDFDAAIRAYNERLRKIDAAREANPVVPPFDPENC